MQKLEDIIAYLYQQSPNKDDLSKGRVTKLIFLADWRMSLMARKQVSDLRWYVNKYGPYADDLETLFRTGDVFVFRDTGNYYGGNKKTIAFKVEDHLYNPALADLEKQVIDATIKATAELGWNEFSNMVNRTYPLVNGEKYDFLDLPQLASQYVHALTQVRS